MTKNKGGRPTKYKEEFNKIVTMACAKGCIDSELAKMLDVEESTINNWKKVHPEFLESIRAGKELADKNVEQALYKKAIGFTCRDTKFATHEGQITDSKEYDKNYPPDTTAAIFWLKNRKPNDWKDKTEVDTTIKANIVSDFGDGEGEEL